MSESSRSMLQSTALTSKDHAIAAKICGNKKKSKFKQAREKQKRKSEAEKEGQYNLSARIVAVHCQRHDQPSDVDMSDKPRLQR